MAWRQQQQQQQQQQQRRRLRKEILSKRREQYKKKHLKGLSLRNFRLVSGLSQSCRVYRCGSTDVLGVKLRCASSQWSDAETLLMRDAGLVIDLRSVPERREDDAQLWMKEASKNTQRFDSTTPKRPIRVLELSARNKPTLVLTDDLFANKSLRYVVRLDVLNRAELVAYAREKWLESPKAGWNEIMTQVNRRGLAGLNEAILETRSGKLGLCLALKIMTLYREDSLTRNPNFPLQQENKAQHHIGCIPIDASIVFHCVQGKDRTGMLAMLIQILLGCSDKIIVEDYYRSNAEFAPHNTSSSSSSSASSAAAEAMLVSKKNKNNRNERVRMDASVFSGTNRPAMLSTLRGLRLRHGQNLEGYFDRIGFDCSWRRRFVNVFGTSLQVSRL